MSGFLPDMMIIAEPGPGMLYNLRTFYEVFMNTEKRLVSPMGNQSFGVEAQRRRPR